MIQETEYIQNCLSSVWPGWKISHLIGRGTYGSVYEIYRDDLDTTYTNALKVLSMEVDESDGTLPDLFNYEGTVHSDAMWNPLLDGKRTSAVFGSASDGRNRQTADNMQSRFIRSVSDEINMMIRLKGHPNIVSIEDYAVIKKSSVYTILIRMEELTPAAEYIGNRGKMTREWAIRLGTDICRALVFCEENRIVHRDIKLNNLFFSDKAGFKLGDFGISRTMASIYDQASMTGVGTLQSMAPEIFQGKKYKNTIDIYSLGIVLYMLMNDNYPPFARENYEKTGNPHFQEAYIRRLRGEQFPAPRNADPALARVIMKACAYRPEDRYQTAWDFQAALKDCAKENKPPKPPGPEKTLLGILLAILKEWMLANGRMLAILAAAAVLVVILAAAGSFFTTPRKSLVGYRIILVDENGNILEETLFKDLEGKEISYTAPQKEGYTLETNKKTLVLGQDLDENQLIFTYYKTEEPEEPEDITERTTEKTTEEESTTKSTTREQTTKKTTEKTTKSTTREQTTKKTTEKTTKTTKKPESSDRIVWKDSALEKAVKEALKITGDLSLKDAAKIKTLNLSNKGITDISALSNFTGLEELYLAENNISKIPSLKKLRKLYKLHLESNRISDVSSLKDLTWLKRLDLCDNQITDISALKGLTNLTMLDIRRNQVEDISSLKGMTAMEELFVSSNRIKDVSPLANMVKLTYLTISFNRVSDISCLKKLTDLRVFTATDNNIRDISVLRRFPLLYHLKLAGNPIEDKSPLNIFSDKVYIDIRKK